MGAKRWSRAPVDAGYLADPLAAGIWGFVGGQDGCQSGAFGTSSGALSGSKMGTGLVGGPD